MTVTVPRRGQKVVITDELELGPDYMRLIQDYVPNRLAIITALLDGKEVPGAHLSNAAPSLTIRSK
jgi:Gp157 protein